MDQHAGTDGAPVGLYAFQLHLEPVGFPRDVIPQQRRRLVKIDNQHIHVTIVVEISEGASTAAMGRRDARARRFD